MPMSNTARVARKCCGDDIDRVIAVVTARIWRVITIWECQLKKMCFAETMNHVIDELVDSYNKNKARGVT